MDHTQITNAFAQNLRARRKELGLSQRQLAEALGYSPKAVSKWERAEGTAPTVLLPRLASLLHISIDSLLSAGGTPEYYLGIDGGGTKTEFVLADSTGQIVSRLVLSGCNPNDIGMPNTLKILKEGLDTLCQTVPPNRISLFAGIAGGTTGKNRENIAEFLSTYRFAACQCGSDAQNAVASALNKDNGLTVIVGTGTVIFVQKDQALTKIGGFNYLFEEGGSGYMLGRDAILHALNSEEQGNTTSPLYSLVLEKCGSATVLAHLADLYAGGKRLIASFAPLVFEAYREQDAAAAEILKRNATVLAKQICRGAAILGTPEVKIVLVGGLTRQEVLMNLVQQQLPESYHITAYQGSLCVGALRLAGLEDPKC